MSWNLSATGTKTGVAKQIAGLQTHGQAVAEAAKTFIAAALEAVPTNGVSVKAHGHHDSMQNSATIEIQSLTLALDYEEAEPASDD